MCSGAGGLYIPEESEPWYIELGLMIGTFILICTFSCIFTTIVLGIKYLIYLL